MTTFTKELYRIGLVFDIGCFTNLTLDHLDYHGTFENYLVAKKTFFDYLSSEATAVINADDPNSEAMVSDTLADVRRCSFIDIAGSYNKRV